MLKSLLKRIGALINRVLPPPVLGQRPVAGDTPPPKVLGSATGAYASKTSSAINLDKPVDKPISTPSARAPRVGYGLVWPSDNTQTDMAATYCAYRKRTSVKVDDLIAHK